MQRSSKCYIGFQEHEFLSKGKQEKTKQKFRNTYFGVQVYEVIDHILTRSEALQPRVKKIIIVQENNKVLVIQK